MRRNYVLVGVVALFTVAAYRAALAVPGPPGPPPPGPSDEIKGDRNKQGLKILTERFEPPLVLDLKKRDKNKVGLGSYLVNAVGGCNDCHTCPSYAPGHNPFDGAGDGKFNGTNYLGGGVPFSPPGISSANLTPNTTNGLPEDEETTFKIFLQRIRTGHDVPERPNAILQVMPWPVFRNMTDDDIRAIYEFLRALPHAEPGTCMFPGE